MSLAYSSGVLEIMFFCVPQMLGPDFSCKQPVWSLFGQSTEERLRGAIGWRPRDMLLWGGKSQAHCYAKPSLILHTAHRDRVCQVCLGEAPRNHRPSCFMLPTLSFLFCRTKHGRGMGMWDCAFPVMAREMEPTFK